MNRSECLSPFALVLCFAVSALLAALASHGGVPGPEIVDTCNYPQPLNPLMPVGGNYVSARQGIVWNGSEYVMAYANGLSQLVFQKIFADGTPDGPPIVNPGGSSGYAYYLFPVSLAFDGTSYAATFMGGDGSSSYWQVYFVKLDLNFSPLVVAKRVSFVGATPTANGYWPQLSAGGGQYAIVWYDARSGMNQVYATILDGDGTVANAGAAHDIALSATAFSQTDPTVGWSPFGANGTGGFQFYWQDYRNAKSELWGEEWSSCCGLYYLNLTVSPASGGAYFPHLAYGPNWGMLVWDDTRNANDEIYFALVNQQGYRISNEIRLTTDGSAQTNPFVAWNGTQFGVIWGDARYAGGDIAFQAVSANAVPLGSSVQITFGLGSSYLYPTAAFAKAGYLGAGYVSQNHNFAVPVGCNYPGNPPCPANMVAYGISGSTATVSWQPSIDPYTDLAYYAVYRNNTLIGKTASTFFADTGLGLSTTYNYVVTAVNAADLASGGCGTGNSLYVQTNASLLLMMDKSSHDARLAWTDASGQTRPSYNVFRGTDPRVMQQVAASGTGSYADPNALLDGVAYFYSVDGPGW